MRILNQTISSMYLWAIALLSAVIAISAYTLRIVPYSLLLAVGVSAFLEFAISRFYLKRQPRIPVSGIITGMIIGSVAPITGSFLLVIAASVIAIVSKFVIKSRHVNILNPAAFGLLASMFVFGVGGQWWAAANYNVYGVALSLTVVLVIAAYEARRWISSLVFIAVTLAFSVFYKGILTLSLSSLAAAFFGINFFFAFVMLAEPKTSPAGKYGQIAFGALVAFAYAALAIYKMQYPLLEALLIGNVIYLAYKLLAANQGRK